MKRLFTPQRNKPALIHHLLPSFTKIFTVSKCACVWVCVCVLFLLCVTVTIPAYTHVQTSAGVHANSRDSLRRAAEDGAALCKCWKAVVLPAAESLHKLFPPLPLRRTNTLTCPRSRTISGAPNRGGGGERKPQGRKRKRFGGGAEGALFLSTASRTPTQPSATHTEISNMTSELLKLMEDGESGGGGSSQLKASWGKGLPAV